MIKKRNIIILLSLIGTYSFGQNLRFNLHDSILPENGKFTTWQIKYADKDDETYEPESSKFIDSIAWFMNKNQNIVLEIQDHREKKSSLTHSFQSAKNITDELIKKGISASRLSAKGYGGDKPYVPDSIVKKAKTKVAAAAMLNKSQRTVLQIKCTRCVSKDRLSKAKSFTDIIPGFKSRGRCNIMATVKGKFYVLELNSATTRTIFDLAEAGSEIFIECDLYNAGIKIIQ